MSQFWGFCPLRKVEMRLWRPFLKAKSLPLCIGILCLREPFDCDDTLSNCMQMPHHIHHTEIFLPYVKTSLEMDVTRNLNSFFENTHTQAVSSGWRLWPNNLTNLLQFDPILFNGFKKAENVESFFTQFRIKSKKSEAIWTNPVNFFCHLR